MSPRKKTILYRSNSFRLTAKSLKQEDLTAELIAPDSLKITSAGESRTINIPQPLPHGCPGYHSDSPLLTAMYAMAMHELHANLSAEGLLAAGATWGSVWTRDMAYAAALGVNLAEPAACRRSLEACVRGGIIRQDTGTGGGWPVSTDRVSWALGAWAYYLSSGDKEWLAYSIDAIKNTLAQDAAVLAPDPLITGETSFLDWREQSYPAWMTPAQIGATYAFGTNVLHYTARRILMHMLTEAGRAEEAERYDREAKELARAINKKFYNEKTHSYSMFVDANGCADPHTDTLATALAVLCGLAGDHAADTLQALPRSNYGTPVFAPYKADTPTAYHNRAIWPFVEAYVLLAHAELQDIAGVEFSMVSLLRAAMAFGTNKENCHAATGAAHETVQSSDRQLWSVAGMLGIYYHGLLGIQYEHNNLVFNPCIPESFAGSHWFTGLRIRDMVLDIHLNGYGNEVCSVIINGKAGLPIIPLDTKGHIQIELELLPADGSAAVASFPTAREDLPTPQWADPAPDMLAWHPVPSATRYCIYADGKPLLNTTKTSYPIKLPARLLSRRYQVRALNQRTSSALSEPYEVLAPKARCILHPCRIGEHTEYTVERRQAWLDTRPCTANLLYEQANLAKGTYLIRICYCNATASLRDGDTCALRELRVDGERIAIIPLPHNTEPGLWEDYSFTAPVKMRISTAGEHTFSLHLTPDCANTNQGLNQCMVRYLEITRVS